LRLSRFDAPRLAELSDPVAGSFAGKAMSWRWPTKLSAAQGISQIEPPKPAWGLSCVPTRRKGLAWLQFLREQNLSGILADDMGLGKTAQALAHLLLEKEEWAARSSGADRFADFAHFQLEERGGALCAESVRPFAARRRAQRALCRDPAARRRADDLSVAVARCARTDPASATTC
jgi:hypothetical protein